MGKESITDIITTVFDKFLKDKFPKPWKITDLEDISEMLVLWPRWGSILVGNKLFSKNQRLYINGVITMRNRILSTEQTAWLNAQHRIEKDIRDFRGEYEHEFVDEKHNYLVQELNEKEIQLRYLEGKLASAKERYGDETMYMYTYIDAIKGTKDKIKRTRARIDIVKGNTEDKRLSRDMINEAKNVPFDRILKVERGTKMAKCPYHNEKTNSFHITPTNKGHCFGCQKTVDNITYLMDTKNYKFQEAVKFLLSI